MQEKNSNNSFKNRIINKFMLRVKAFNEKHRKCARITTAFALIILAILSILLGIAEKICDVILGLFGSGKRFITVLATVLLIVAIVAAAIWVKNSKKPDAPDVNDKSAEQIVDTLVEAELSKAEDEKEPAVESSQGISEEAKESEESTQGISEEAKESEESTQEISEEAKAIEESTQDLSEENKEVTESAQGASQEAEELRNAEYTQALVDISEVDLEAFMKKYPETVGWLYFEDGHISYPIMQDGDNNKYRKLDYTGEEARTGAIFLDYRSAADFSDSNSIIYGHYMKDRTMFGTLRDYREDPKYYNDHQYFQVITPDKIYRYQIFAYMDVPKSYVIYDYIGDASYEFVKDAEPVRIKSYMDSEIVVNKTKKVVTLSTCTDKDKLYFVVLGVMVEEKDR